MLLTRRKQALSNQWSSLLDFSLRSISNKTPVSVFYTSVVVFFQKGENRCNLIDSFIGDRYSRKRPVPLRQLRSATRRPTVPGRSRRATSSHREAVLHCRGKQGRGLNELARNCTSPGTAATLLTPRHTRSAAVRAPVHRRDTLPQIDPPAYSS